MTNTNEYVEAFKKSKQDELDSPDGRVRLRLLAEFLLGLPKERFDLRQWWSDGFQPHECGTTACACGWACVIFPGLSRTNSQPSLTNEPLDCHLKYGWWAMEKFFDLNEDWAYEFFLDSRYGVNPAPSEVSDKIFSYLERTNNGN